MAFLRIDFKHASCSHTPPKRGRGRERERDTERGTEKKSPLPEPSDYDLLPKRPKTTKGPILDFWGMEANLIGILLCSAAK